MPYLYLVVVAGVDVARHAEIGDLDDEAGAHETVSAGEISMNESLCREIRHSRCYLRRYPVKGILRTFDHNTKDINIRVREHMTGFSYGKTIKTFEEPISSIARAEFNLYFRLIELPVNHIFSILIVTPF